jgi:hypothetical protein
MVSGTSFICKKIKEQGFLRKSHQKTYPMDPRSGKNSSRIQGVKKHRIPDLQLVLLVFFLNELFGDFNYISACSKFLKLFYDKPFIIDESPRNMRFCIASYLRPAAWPTCTKYRT